MVLSESPAAASEALVAIATYNERDNIRRLLGEVLDAAPVDALLIDDSSPDGTGQILDEIAVADPRVRVLHRPSKLGVASAHVLAFRYAQERGYQLLVEMDADFSHPPSDLPKLLAACAAADVAVGSRSVRGGRILGRSRLRDALTRLGSGYARVVLRLPIRDCTGGFRCTRRAAWEVVDWERVRSRGYGFQLELNHAWARAGLRFIEVPIVFRDRSAGVSKMSWGILAEALLVVPRLRLGLIRAALRPPSRRAPPP